MKKMVVDDKIKPKPPLIMELVGPAGAGKTTLSRALSKRDEEIVIGPDIELRKVSHLPVFIRSIPSSVPLFLYQRKSNRQLTWTELKDIAYLKGWPDLLRRRSSNTGKVILLDQGPVRSEEHTSELQSQSNLVCRLLLEKKKKKKKKIKEQKKKKQTKYIKKTH